MTRTARRWTPDEITKLKEMAGKHPRDTIADWDAPAARSL